MSLSGGRRRVLLRRFIVVLSIVLLSAFTALLLGSDVTMNPVAPPSHNLPLPTVSPMPPSPPFLEEGASSSREVFILPPVTPGRAAQTTTVEYEVDGLYHNDSASERSRERLYWIGGRLKPLAGKEGGGGGVWEVGEGGGSIVPKDVCGAAALTLLDLSFKVVPSLLSRTSPSPVAALPLWSGHIQSNRPYPSDIQFAGRMVLRIGIASEEVLVTPLITAVSPTRWSVTFHVPTAVISSYCQSPGSEIMLVVAEVDLRVTWVGTKFLGQLWSLPNRNDNPGFQEMKRKCLALTLTGDCDRFGVRLAMWEHSAASPVEGRDTFPAIPSRTVPCANSTLLLSPRPLSFGGGYWRAITESISGERYQGVEGSLTIVDDAVGLNRWRNSTWVWEDGRDHHQPSSAASTVSPSTTFPSKASVANSLLRGWLLLSKNEGGGGGVVRKEYALLFNQPVFKMKLHLVGDSMLLEQFHMWATLLGVPFDRIRNGKGGGGLRWMQFISDTFRMEDDILRLLLPPLLGGDGGSSSGGGGAVLLSTFIEVEVRFLRGYTTSSGKSVIASNRRLLTEMDAYKAPIVLTNLASLHWQQNMRSITDWDVSVSTFVEGLWRGRRDAMGGSRRSLVDRLVVYWGATQIQMGRTQGLNPSRTKAFNQAARAAFGPPLSLLGDGALQTSNKGGHHTAFFDPFPLSMARWESSFDGQHWACYHKFGGVSISITLQFLVELSRQRG